MWGPGSTLTSVLEGTGENMNLQAPWNLPELYHGGLPHSHAKEGNSQMQSLKCLSFCHPVEEGLSLLSPRMSKVARLPLSSRHEPLEAGVG